VAQVPRPGRPPRLAITRLAARREAGRRVASHLPGSADFKGEAALCPSSLSRLPARSHEERVRASADPARPRFMPIDPSCGWGASEMGIYRFAVCLNNAPKTVDRMVGLQVRPLVDSVCHPAPRERSVDLAGPLAEHFPAVDRTRKPDHCRGRGEGASSHQSHRRARTHDPDRPWIRAGIRGSRPAGCCATWRKILPRPSRKPR
jgi:hypothetical protein